jgi:hypothetical protein
MNPRSTRRLALVAGLLFLGAVVLPVVSYRLGKWLIGPFEGKRGLTDYLGSIYQAAGRGEPGAWLLLLAPLLLVLVWYGTWRALKRGNNELP